MRGRFHIPLETLQFPYLTHTQQQSKIHAPKQRSLMAIAQMTTHDLMHMVAMIHELERHRSLTDCEEKVLRTLTQTLIEALTHTKEN